MNASCPCAIDYDRKTATPSRGCQDLPHVGPHARALFDAVARIANPASYLVQKVLTKREGAGRAKVGKDLLYIHDTLQMFGPRLHLATQCDRNSDDLPSRAAEDLRGLTG